MKKIALITGASRGIGAQIAKTFAQNNYTVIINYNSSQKLAENVVAEIIGFGGEALAIKADVANKNEVEKMFQTIIKIFGHIDVLVNNAGISLNKLLIDCEEEDFDKIISINLKGTFLASKYALKSMISQQSGCIVNISSFWGQTGGANETLYSASKAGVIGLTKAMAKEYALCNIRVNAVSAGVIKTQMNDEYGENFYEEIKQQIPTEKIGCPQDVADAVLFLVSKQANYITGQILNVNGGILI